MSRGLIPTTEVLSLYASSDCQFPVGTEVGLRSVVRPRIVHVLSRKNPLLFNHVGDASGQLNRCLFPFDTIVSEQQ